MNEVLSRRECGQGLEIAVCALSQCWFDIESLCQGGLRWRQLIFTRWYVESLVVIRGLEESLCALLPSHDFARTRRHQGPC